MRRHQAFEVPPAVGVGAGGPARQHHLDDAEEPFGDLEVALVAGVMEGDQDLVRQPSAMARRDASGAGRSPSCYVLVRLFHDHDPCTVRDHFYATAPGATEPLRTPERREEC